MGKPLFFFLILLVIVVTAAIGRAEIYKWVDDKGTTYFTEDPSTIPEKYRGVTKSRTTEEDLMTPAEKLKAKKEQEKRVKEGIESDRKEHERSLEEEKLRRATRDYEEKQYEIKLEQEKLKKKAEEAARKEQEERENAYKKCWNCDGKGWIGVEVLTRGGGSANMRKTCSICNGEGKVKR